MVHDTITSAVQSFLEPGEQLRYGARGRFWSTVGWKRMLKLGRRRGCIVVTDRRALLVYDGVSTPTSIPFERLAKVEHSTFVHSGLVTLCEADGTEHPIELYAPLGADTYGDVTFLREAPDFLRARIATHRR